MNIRLLEELQTGEYETAVFLTYTANLRFFESMILPRLRRMGVSRIGILIDQRGYQASLADPLAQEFCGQEYILAPVRLSGGGIQHAKLLWLQKQGKITAYLGSHNLTMAGYNDQVEVTAKLTSTEPGHIQALRDLYEVISSIMPSALNYVWRHTTQPPEVKCTPIAMALTSFSHPLLDQIVDQVQTVDDLRVVTPFLDAAALKKLARAVQARGVILDLPKEGADTPLLQSVEAIPGLQPRFLSGRRLHAKAYQFTTLHTSWLAIGSANCTNAALTKSVAEGGNLEFLLLLKDTILPDDLKFTSIADPAIFPHTGRNWDEDRSPLTPIIIEQASYSNRQLSVEWQLPKDRIVSNIALYVDEKTIPCNTSSSTSVPFDIPPRIFTLKATINGHVVETSAWVINYNALEEKVSRTKLRQWAERIASNDPHQHADSINIWLEQQIQELLRIHHESESTHFLTEPTQKNENIRPIQLFYEVFTYSSNPEEIQASAKLLLTDYSNLDPLVLLRALLIRFAAEPPADLVADNNKEESSQHSNLPYYFTRRSLAAQNIVKNLSRQLDRLAHIEVVDTISEQIFTIGLRSLLGATTYICLDVIDASSLNDIENLIQHFIDLLEWLTYQLPINRVVQRFQIKGPLLLSIGAIAKIAERSKDSNYLLRLRKYTKRLIQEDPRQIITSWRCLDPKDVDSFLTLLRRDSIWHMIEPHLLALFEMAPDHLKRLVEQRWGFLLELQKADMQLSSERENLYARAKAKCSDLQIWARYDRARRMKNLPVVFYTNGNICSKCSNSLPTQKSQHLRKGEAVVCDNCYSILLLKG